MNDIAERAAYHLATWVFKLVVVLCTVACTQGCVPPDDVPHEGATVTATLRLSTCPTDGGTFVVSYDLAPPRIVDQPALTCEVGELFECEGVIGQDVASLFVAIDHEEEVLIVRTEPIGVQGPSCRWEYQIIDTVWR